MKNHDIKNIIISKFEGGLGNIMFQYALGKNLALKNKSTLLFDITSYKTNPLGDYSFALEKFNIDIRNNVASLKQIKSLKKYKVRPGRRWFLHNYFFADNRRFIQEKTFNLNPNILTLGNNIYLQGWWQTEKYFKDIREVLLKDFTIKNPSRDINKKIAEQIQHTSSVGIHIRRCDYVTNPKTKKHHGVLSEQYYKNALEKIKSTVENPLLFVFSDDIHSVQQNMFSDFETVYIDWNKKESQEDMHLMSLCKHNIIANSSFGWWGAWLNQNEDRLVIAPSQWFADTPKNKTKDIIPEDWIQISPNFE